MRTNVEINKTCFEKFENIIEKERIFQRKLKFVAGRGSSNFLFDDISSI